MFGHRNGRHRIWRPEAGRREDVLRQRPVGDRARRAGQTCDVQFRRPLPGVWRARAVPATGNSCVGIHQFLPVASTSARVDAAGTDRRTPRYGTPTLVRCDVIRVVSETMWLSDPRLHREPGPRPELSCLWLAADTDGELDVPTAMAAERRAGLRASKDLGRYLTERCVIAGLEQVESAKLIRYSRSQITNVQVRDNTTRQFWHSTHAALGTGGALLTVFGQVNVLVRDLQTQRDRASDQERKQLAVPQAPPTSEVATCSVACGCGPAVVGRWTGREVRALRGVLRMAVHAFTDYLGVTRATVSDWEYRTAPAPPRLAAQAVLDQVLTLADTDSKARFRLPLVFPDFTTSRALQRRETAGRSAVTQIQKRAGHAQRPDNHQWPRQEGAAMHQPIPTLRGTPTHATAVELYQGHHGTAAGVCARCGSSTPCLVRTFAASAIAASGEDPRSYDARRGLPASAGPVAAQAREPDLAPALEPDLGRTQSEPFGFAVGGRGMPLDAEGLLYEREQ